LHDLYKKTISECARAGLRYPALYSLLTVRSARKAIKIAIAPTKPRATQDTLRQLLVDVSEIVKRDAGTGIQRVVRNILLQLLYKPPAGYEIRPVYASRYKSYRYADRFCAALLERNCIENPDLPVRFAPGDVFLGLDLAAHLLPHHHRTLGQWKASGIRLFFLIYDLLPVHRPDWFNPKRAKTFRRWLRTLAIYSDCLICISETTSEDLEKWLLKQHGLEEGSLPVRSFHLGTDFTDENHNIEKGNTETDRCITRLQGRRSILMVGTIEPRKGYAQALSAFEILWGQENQINLVIVGKAGWKVDQLIDRLRKHPEAGIRLHWFENASDELLLQLYGIADGLLIASEGEGFGLPVIEAARFNKPILMRDIPVLREIANTDAQYFKGIDANTLASALRNWLHLIAAGQAPFSRAIKSQTWAESTEQLVLSMTLDRSFKRPSTPGGN
jgi:glycosyltransferase involved in cell wall biosynthesis